MKSLFFSERGLNPILKTVTVPITYGLTKTAPNKSAEIALNLFCRPHSRRTYSLDTLNVEEQVTEIPTRLGQVALHRFGSGNKHALLSHGWSDTTKRFTPIIKELIQLGYTVWSLDHIGHGRSDGKVSHLFAYIEGLGKTMEYLDSISVNPQVIVTHSMGGLALLNLDDSWMRNALVIPISMPANFFESMFETMERTGIAKLVLANLLNKISEEFAQPWQQLKADQHIHKIHQNFVFIHDEQDPIAPITHLQRLVTASKHPSVEIKSTKSLGHVKITRDPNVINFIKQQVESYEKERKN